MNTEYLFVLLGIALWTLSCGGPAGKSSQTSGTSDPGQPGIAKGEQELAVYLEKQEKQFEDISVQNGLAQWSYYSMEGDVDFSIIEKRYAELLLDKRLNLTIDHWIRHLDSLSDPVLQRRIKIWNDMIIGARVDLSKDVREISGVLKEWLSADKGSPEGPSAEEIEQKMIALFIARNKKATGLGYANYAQMVLQINETGADWFSRQVELIEKKTRAPYEKLLTSYREENNKNLAYSDISDLVYQYEKNLKFYKLASRQHQSLLNETIGNIGLNLAEMRIRTVETKMPKGFGGNSFPVRIPTDFRVIINSEINLPFYYRLHEFGHGLQRTHNLSEFPVLKGYEWIVGTECPAWVEGIAESIARFTTHEDWKKRYGEGPGDVAQTSSNTESASAYLRFNLVNAMFELELYKDPTQDTRQLWDNLLRRYLLIDKSSDGGRSIAYLSYVTYPVYEQNYLLAEIISWQIHSDLSKKFGSGYPFNKKVGPYLMEHYWRNGEYVPWQDILRKTTGRALDTEGYLQSLGIQ